MAVVAVFALAVVVGSWLLFDEPTTGVACDGGVPAGSRSAAAADESQLSAPPNDVELAHSEGAARGSEDEPAVVPTASGPRCVLSVHVRDRNGRFIPKGRLECVYSASSLRDSVARARLEFPVTGEVLRIELPNATDEVLLTASAPEHAPASALLQSLRLIGGRTLSAAESVSRDVHLTLDLRDSDARVSIWGKVRVDGVERIPDGLSMELQRFAPPAGVVIEEAFPDLATVDVYSSSYSLRIPAAGRFAIRAKSSETIEETFEFELASPASHERHDLDLKTGARVLIRVLDATSGQPAPSVQLLMRCSRLVEASSEALTRSEYRKVSESDHAGICLFRGIAPRSPVKITQYSLEKPRGFGNLLELEVPEAGTQPHWFDYWINGADPTEVVYWGPVDAAWNLGKASSICSEASDVPGRGFVSFSIPPDAVEWTVRRPAGKRFSFWISENGARRTGVTTAITTQGGRFGPVVLEQLGQARFVLLVTTPTSGWKVRASAGGPQQLQGGDQEAVTSTEPARLELAGPEGSDLVLSLEHPQGGGWYFKWNAPSGVERERVVDLSNWKPRALVIHLQGKAVDDERSVQLVDLTPRFGASIAAATIHWGSRAIPNIPVPASEYFFRVTPFRDGCWVFGVLRVDGAPSDAVRIAWDGELRALASDAFVPGARLILESLGGLVFDERVPAFVKGVRVSDLFPTVASDGATIFTAPGSSFRVETR